MVAIETDGSATEKRKSIMSIRSHNTFVIKSKLKPTLLTNNSIKP